MLYVYLAAMVAATSGLLFGFDIAVINGAIIFLREQLHLSEFETEVAASSLLFGCIFGASIAGWMSDRLGRRRVLMYCAVLFTVSSIGAALPRTLIEFICARFLGGIAIGAASVLAPLYIAEVAPARNRGRLVAMNQMAIVTGILVAYLVNWSLSFTGANGWRWMFAAAALPSVFFLVALFFVPESPRWLVEQNRASEALAVLTKVNGPEGAQELRQIEEAVAEETGSMAELLAPGLRHPFLLTVALAILQQITGLNTVLFYGSIIFKEQVGQNNESAAIFASVIIGIVNFVVTIISMVVIDRWGRRFLLLFSSGVMMFCQLALGAAFLLHPPPAWLVLAAMLACGASFAIGLGPVVWVLIAEVFPTRIRGRAMSIATICLWVACTALTLTFLTLVKWFTATGAFWLYASMCALTFFVVWRWAPETKGRTLEEIERSWRHV